MHKFRVATNKRAQLIDITRQVEETVAKAAVRSGLCVVHVPHTTAGVFVNESADPELRRDFLEFLEKLIPQDPSFRHSEGNADAHLKSVFTGHSATLPIDEGRLALGTWQAIWFGEFDGPRNREVWVQVLGA